MSVERAAILERSSMAVLASNTDAAVRGLEATKTPTNVMRIEMMRLSAHLQWLAAFGADGIAQVHWGLIAATIERAQQASKMRPTAVLQ